MASDNPRYWGYIAAAFNLKVPLPGLGQLPLNKLLLAVFAVLGLANPGFWFLGAALETGYLLALAGNERFQRLVQGLRIGAKSRPQRAEVGPERQLALIASLDPASRSRYQNLTQTCSEVLRPPKAPRPRRALRACCSPAGSASFSGSSSSSSCRANASP